MSKVIKEMEMNVLRKAFGDVRDMVLLNIVGVDAVTENTNRLALRKKKIRLQMVKNSLARRVFAELGIKTTSEWTGSTTVAWGADSLAALSKEIEAISKKNDKYKAKWAISEGQEIAFAKALTMPTREEAIGRVVSLALSPASRLISQILAPASQLVGQIKEVGKGKEGEPAAPAAEAAAAPAG